MFIYSAVCFLCNYSSLLLENYKFDAPIFRVNENSIFSLPIYRFIGERNRSLCERIFWVIFVSIGVFFSGYFTLGIIQKWQNSPVYMSVGDTSHHVAKLPFPAVTICSVNKIGNAQLFLNLVRIGH